MADLATYAFLPWARRGLAARVETPDAPALPARAAVRVGLTVSNLTPKEVALALYGPGDVIGVDPRMILRTDPRPLSTDVEPNYFASIDFDPPDLPWLFTPARATPEQRLRPWLVLVVVDLERVKAPKMLPKRPLPVLEVASAVMATELPDLAESWGWAHAQVLRAGGDLRAELRDSPALNVSRLVCPRRLEPGKRYAACLVPAFEPGARRGRGDTPPEDAPCAPAWDVRNPRDLELPVYYHWEFATGPLGDFELLARRLTPFTASARLGLERMYLGDAGPPLPPLDPARDTSYLDMDGALRAPAAAVPASGDVPAAIAKELRDAVNEAADLAERTAAPDDAPAVGPPAYGGWHVKRQTVPEDAGWFAELNTDPRSRVAAGLGGEVVRQNQETFMAWCWEQVGSILDANALLSRARLAMEAGSRLHERHLQALPPDRLIQLAGPLHSRARVGALTVRAAIRRSSLPDAAADVSLRRLTSPQRALHKQARRAVGRAFGGEATAAAGITVVRRLAEGALRTDYNVYLPDGLAGSAALERLSLPAGAEAVDLSPIGPALAVPATRVRELRESAAAVRGEPATAPLAVRDDFRTVGLIGDAQLARARELTATEPRIGVGTNELLDGFRSAVASSPGGRAYRVTLGGTRPRVDPLDVDAGGRVTVRGAEGTVAEHVATIDPTLLGGRHLDLGRVLAESPATRVEPARGGIRDEITAATPAAEPTMTFVPPTLDAATLGRFERAVEALETVVAAQPAAPNAAFVAFGLAPARDAIVQRTEPRAAIRLRLSTMLSIQGATLEAPGSGLRPSGTLDRIMAYPTIAQPGYGYLAAYDRTRFLPGIEEVPPDGITLLETNPRFIEAFMVGLNHEMNRELLWREFPTDQRGSPLRKFWAWVDNGDDIDPSHAWAAAQALGRHTRGAGDAQLVILIRGQLLRRYPTTAVYAWRASGRRLVQQPGAGDIVRPVFGGVLPPDLTFFGFPLTRADLSAGDGWYFVLEQQVSEPRFGLDEGPADQAPPALARWSDASWAHTGVAPGAHLSLTAGPLAAAVVGGVPFAGHAGLFAGHTWQQPVRVAVPAKKMVGLDA
jgi:hypothetical protein